MQKKVKLIPTPIYRIALYPGDGIGPEVIDATVAVLDAVQRAGGFRLEYQRFDWGMAHYDQHGRVAPDDFLTTLRGFDAILLGAVGWPARLPDHVTLAPLIRMRQAFDLYACVRPARTFPGVPRPAPQPRAHRPRRRPRELRRRVRGQRRRGRKRHARRGRRADGGAHAPRRGAHPALLVRAGPHAAPPADDDHQVERAAVRIRAVGPRAGGARRRSSPT